MKKTDIIIGLLAILLILTVPIGLIYNYYILFLDVILIVSAIIFVDVRDKQKKYNDSQTRNERPPDAPQGGVKDASPEEPVD